MKTFILKNKINDIEYIIKVKLAKGGTTYKLLGKDSELLITIVDTGNGMTISKRIPKELNYHEFAGISHLLRFIRKWDTSLCETLQVSEEINDYFKV
jgi:hypothetical protein